MGNATTHNRGFSFRIEDETDERVKRRTSPNAFVRQQANPARQRNRRLRTAKALQLLATCEAERRNIPSHSDPNHVAGSCSLPEDLDLRAVGVPTTECHVVLGRSVVLDFAYSFRGGGQDAVETEDVCGSGDTEADVEAVGELLVLFGGYEREKEPLSLVM
jgi:hypothetical protein